MNDLLAAYDDDGDGCVDLSPLPVAPMRHRKVQLLPPAELLKATEPPEQAQAKREEPAVTHKPALAIAHRMWRAATVALWRSDHDDLLGGDAADALTGPGPTEGEMAAWFEDRARYIPLRLALRERKPLRLLEGMVGVAEYTTLVDTPQLASNPARRAQRQLKEVSALLAGLLTALDEQQGFKVVSRKPPNFAPFEQVYANVFEGVRRYKVMNPEKMRVSYGKMLYLLQDSALPDVAEFTECNLIKPLDTVYEHLKRHNGLALLRDELLGAATQCIAPEPGKSRAQLQQDIRTKERAVEMLVRKYASRALPEDAVRLALYSIGDNNAYLHQARDPIDRVIHLLCQHFDPKRAESDELSLAISDGAGGARLSHSHARQHNYVLQSLVLWREIANDMFKLWCLAEADLLDGSSPYELRDTGQGLQRVQPAPRTEKAMKELLHRTQRKLGSWVGSAVIHMGDSNVPNALTFIDKYAAIERILNPLLSVLDAIAAAPRAGSPQLQAYIAMRWQSPLGATKCILADFFRFAFDGSGADNFYDAGSCIDGRLTSAWNWCSQLPQKPFYPLFKMCGFIGFDGEFQLESGVGIKPSNALVVRTDAPARGVRQVRARRQDGESSSQCVRSESSDDGQSSRPRRARRSFRPTSPCAGSHPWAPPSASSLVRALGGGLPGGLGGRGIDPRALASCRVLPDSAWTRRLHADLASAACSLAAHRAASRAHARPLAPCPGTRAIAPRVTPARWLSAWQTFSDSHLMAL
eukprot:CAMPEP_0185179846 /NCGR_PEP_ID=MMETSP1139-20130426/32212_1 /TAXON_ID=298111 /ORGANISM="Pavlova sp., Strain CCMP459" /LENGTH=753 /DNA_ID=CAMNT_0027745681 /DNA_START=14 /DNA_END=2273 /DNA_ORIENTATION=-